MFNSSKDFEKTMYDILLSIRDNPDTRELFSKVGDINFDDALVRCVDTGLINGLFISKDANGQLSLSIQREVRLSHEGLSFVESFDN